MVPPSIDFPLLLGLHYGPARRKVCGGSEVEVTALCRLARPITAGDPNGPSVTAIAARRRAAIEVAAFRHIAGEEVEARRAAAIDYAGTVADVEVPYGEQVAQMRLLSLRLSRCWGQRQLPATPNCVVGLLLNPKGPIKRPRFQLSRYFLVVRSPMP